MTSGTYTETDVKDFFDQTLQTYLSFWDSDGVLHTGYFRGDDDTDYRGASDRTSEILADYATDHAAIDRSSHVLDVGCGCGNFLMYLAERFECTGNGLDLSGERIRFARSRAAASRGPAGAPRIVFDHGSATAMPYPDGTFTHVVSQDALCLVPDKHTSHREIHRVLRPGGVFAFSDFLQPRPDVSDRARTHVYDRVRWNSGFSLIGYQQALADVGFDIMLARNLGGHLRQTYRVLGVTARERAAQAADPAAREWMLAFAESCGEIQVAIDDGEFGWGMFVARKRSR